MSKAIKSQYLFLSITVLTILLIGTQLAATAQTDDPVALKARAKALVESLKMTEALPLYERLVKLTPNDPEVHFYLALSLIAQATNTADELTGKQLRIRARNEFIKAKDLGDNSQILKGFIEGMPADGSAGNGYSDNAEANRLMNAAEAAFSSGKLDDALAKYQEALKADPRCYYAALFSGDVFTQRGNFPDAIAWYQKAIAIDQNRETAYRYSATPLMKQGKYDQARDLYVEAYIVDPYNRLARNGIVQWGQITKTRIGHPRIDVPEMTVGPDGKQNTTLNVDPLADDGSMAWIAYSATRGEWKKDKFAKAFPKESVYRHSLAEEADALRSVVSMAKTLKPKALNTQIAIIADLDKDGVLEAYILLARADDGISREHPSYLRSNRDKLRKYALNYVIERK